ncbi:MAG TPA: maleylpyruvate isomerase family mycothiol-dependent enzyme [Aquihabitans sp.]|mgnify:CR=1 FL=1|nr:maleylpyruvate isomerase family mycothiol-dependent enzyme [Aquihabitans sp.]
MPTIVDHDATVELLRSTWGAIAELCEPLDDAAWATPTCLPGWTVKDQLSHLVGTEEMLLGRDAPTADVSHLTHLRNDIAKMNEVRVESRRSATGAEVLAAFRAATAERLAALDAMDQAAFDAPSWTPAGPDETYGRFMRIRAYDSFQHEHDIREAVGAPDRLDPAALASALDETATALGYIVGRRAGLPEGQRVRIDLTGPVTATYLVEVTDRARPVDELSGPPTVDVTLPSLTWLRLTGGRADGATLVGSDVTIEGDAELGRQLVANLAFTI